MVGRLPGLTCHVRFCFNRERLRRPLQFAGLSGIGWLIDTAVYLALIGNFHFSVFYAGVLGGICGASFGFLTANRFVFPGGTRGLSRRLTTYIVYTTLLIIVASALVDLVCRGLWCAAAYFKLVASWPTIAFLAKCVVTPALLTANFLLARKLSQKPN